MKEEYEKVLKANVDIAKKLLKLKGNLTPMFILHKGKEIIPIVTPFENDMSKDMLNALLKKIIIDNKADFYVLMNEGWYIKVDKNDDLSGIKRPSENPERKEMLLISFFSKDGEKKQVSIPFEWRVSRNKNTIKFGKRFDTEEFESRFNAYKEMDITKLGV